MGALLVALLATTSLSLQADTLPTYATPATRRAVERAMARHREQDAAVADYRARLRYRLALSAGRWRWGRIPTLAVEELEGRVHWSRPNDLRVDIAGRRLRTRSDDWSVASVFDRPWFVPRALGDSVRVFGSDFPERAPLHPLAPDGPAWYHYALTDSLRIAAPGGGELRLARVEVRPKRSGPALVTGRLWLDAARGDVVRFAFRYVGTSLWREPEGPTAADSAEARRANAFVHRILSLDADLEYALVDGRHWMPYRQVLSGRLEAPFVTDVVLPFRVTTSFGEYEVNTGDPVAFDRPFPPPDDSLSAAEREARRDSLRAERRGRGRRPGHVPRDALGWWPGGRYQVHTAPEDSLGQYRWPDSLVLDSDPEEDRRVREVQHDLARLAGRLPDDLTGRQRHGVAYERLADAFAYNRVQGLSFGVGYRVLVPGSDFTALYGTARYGLSDGRVLARLSLRREGPGGRWSASGYRELRGVDPFAPGLSLANTANALLAGHDDADYLLARGAAAGWEGSPGAGLELSIALRFERQRSVRAVAESELNDLLGGSGRFPPNPPVAAGDFATLGGRLDGVRGTGRWSLGAEGIAGEGRSTLRGYGAWRQRIGGGRGGVVVTARAGAATSPTLPQAAFRAGGLATVRGFDYGTRRGQGFWAVQVDVPLSTKLVRPVLFADAGHAAPLGRLFDEEPLVGAGVGVSILRGLLRLDFSYPVSEGGRGRVRFDLVFGGAR